MNLVSTLVGLSVTASAMPMMAQMALTPTIATTRAANFATAESTAVTFAANNEGQMSLTSTPDNCDLQDIGDNAYMITCYQGEGTYRMSASRSFREGVSEQENRTFDYPTPLSYTHYPCPHFDPWGVTSFNRTHLGGQNCVPIPLQSAANFAASDPDTWLWDISNQGF